ncbi:response regulator transcription factor [Nocardioides mesophilus]|uniref:Response regulator transcription factor n=2 Tax=Nocardioides mesophilus TaxID=433659 RepID=A0A7G9RGM4_9ACTN|nr:response regulator transcription factor [Nocardioides mesophilus]
MADDHARIRGVIRQALERAGCEVVGEGASADDAVRLTLEHRPDVALLDIHMPGSGIAAARQISRAQPEVAVVMLTQSAEEDDVFDSLRAGASGYLLKDTDPARLGFALRGVLAGEAAMPRRLVARILDEFRAPAKRRFTRKSPAAAKLSEREWEVMEMLGEGLSTEEVAGRLFLSPTTVRVHVSSVLKKLRVKDRQSAFDLLRDQ